MDGGVPYLVQAKIHETADIDASTRPMSVQGGVADRTGWKINGDPD